jgi:low affinity Fe/Cu permease
MEKELIEYNESGFKVGSKVCETINDILTAAMNQMTSYLFAMKEVANYNSKKTIQAFTVIHIHQNTVIVVGHRLNGQIIENIRHGNNNNNNLTLTLEQKKEFLRDILDVDNLTEKELLEKFEKFLEDV